MNNSDTEIVMDVSRAEHYTIPYFEMGTGFLIGLAIGYVLKKSFKILLFASGVVLIAMFVLESQGVITIDEAHMQQTFASGVDGFKHFMLFLKERLENFKVSGGLSAVAGFFVGLKIG